MFIKVYPICSKLHDKVSINEATSKLLKDLAELLDLPFLIVNEPKELYSADSLPLILVQSGGSEGQFLKEKPQLKEPYYLLTHGTNNSLAASIEILSYLKSINCNAEILHGSAEYIANRLKELLAKSEPQKIKLGVLGKPSDWLIASNTNYGLALKRYGIELVDINLNEFIDIYPDVKVEDFQSEYEFKGYSEEEINKAKRVYLAIKKLMSEKGLSGITVRCFDLLSKINTTSCLALALLNSEGLIGTCEGDIPSMISMALLNRHFDIPSFQCNPSRIDIATNTIILAHCTLPLSMCDSYKLDSHYESGIGVGIKGELPTGDITIFKMSNDMKNYFVAEGTIVKNLNEENLCRTQIEVKLDDDVSYFLKNPYGNHHIVVKGHIKDQIIAMMRKYN